MPRGRLRPGRGTTVSVICELQRAAYSPKNAASAHGRLLELVEQHALVGRVDVRVAVGGADQQHLGVRDRGLRACSTSGIEPPPAQLTTGRPHAPDNAVRAAS